MIRILAACSPGEVRVAAASGNTLMDYALWRPGRPDGVGDVFRGRVLAPVPALGGAFVALLGADGFLPDQEGAAGLTEGAAVCVRVTRAAQGGKGPRLTARLPQTAGPPGLMQRGPGAVERLAARYPDAPVLADDPALVASLRPALGVRLSVEAQVFDDGMAAQIEALASPDVALPGGARLSIHPTPALVAIDIDSGGTSADRRPKQVAQMAANLALLPALARQIRLRNLSGAIVVDVAGLSMAKRAALGPGFTAALAGDPLRPRFLGITALGLAEILRTRVHPPLHELLAGPHAAGLLALRHIMQDAAADPAAQFRLRAAPDVAAALDADGVAQADLARRTGRPLVLHSDPTLPPGTYAIERP